MYLQVALIRSDYVHPTVINRIMYTTTPTYTCFESLSSLRVQLNQLQQTRKVVGGFPVAQIHGFKVMPNDNVGVFDRINVGLDSIRILLQHVQGLIAVSSQSPQIVSSLRGLAVHKLLCFYQRIESKHFQMIDQLVGVVDDAIQVVPGNKLG